MNRIQELEKLIAKYQHSYYTNEAESLRYMYEEPKTNWTSTNDIKKKLTEKSTSLGGPTWT